MKNAGKSNSSDGGSVLAALFGLGVLLMNILIYIHFTMNPRRQIMQKVTPFVAIEAQKMLSELTVSFFISTNHLNNY